MPEYVPPIGDEPDVWIHWPAQHADYVSPGASAALREAARIITWDARRTGKGLALRELDAMTLLLEMAARYDGSITERTDG